MGRGPLKGHLDLLLRPVLADGPAHGYAIISNLKARSGGDLPEGTPYPAAFVQQLRQVRLPHHLRMAAGRAGWASWKGR